MRAALAEATKHVPQAPLARAERLCELPKERKVQAAALLKARQHLVHEPRKLYTPVARRSTFERSTPPRVAARKPF